MKPAPGVDDSNQFAVLLRILPPTVIQCVRSVLEAGQRFIAVRWPWLGAIFNEYPTTTCTATCAG